MTERPPEKPEGTEETRIGEGPPDDTQPIGAPDQPYYPPAGQPYQPPAEQPYGPPAEQPYPPPAEEPYGPPAEQAYPVQPQPPAQPEYQQPGHPQPYNQPGYQQPYGQPGYGPYPPVAAGPRTNGLAVASMVLGILWLYWIGSILALIFGYVAKSQIDESGGTQSGGGMALAGIVLGWVGVGFLLLFILLAIIAGSAPLLAD
jgi:hypothetical protein